MKADRTEVDVKQNREWGGKEMEAGERGKKEGGERGADRLAISYQFCRNQQTYQKFLHDNHYNSRN